ncbi:MAG: DUF4936 family protein [Betaproteobacteria bacterium]|nr:DUF4936 family protein [Betaproteobacteria bacterium]
MNYYVYYKVEAGQLPSVRAWVDRFFRAAKERFKVDGRLLRRRDDPATYMEVYEGIADPDAFDAFLETEARVLGIDRHVERFIAAEVGGSNKR